MDGLLSDTRTANILRHLPSFVPRIFSGKDETVISEKPGNIHRVLHFRCVCQPAKIKVKVRQKNDSAKEVGEKFAESSKLQDHAHCASTTAGLFPPVPTDTDSAMDTVMDTVMDTAENTTDTLQAATSVHEAPAVVGERPAKAPKTVLKAGQKTAARDSRKLTEANTKIRSLEAQVIQVGLPS